MGAMLPAKGFEIAYEGVTRHGLKLHASGAPIPRLPQGPGKDVSRSFSTAPNVRKTPCLAKKVRLKPPNRVKILEFPLARRMQC